MFVSEYSADSRSYLSEREGSYFRRIGRSASGASASNSAKTNFRRTT